LRKHQVLLAVLLIIVANFIYLYPKLNYSPVPSKWSVGIDWGRYYILQKGRIYNGDVEPPLTWQSDIKNYGSADILPKILFAILNLITGTTGFPEDLKLHYAFPWVGTIFLPIIILSLFTYLSKEEKRFNYLDCYLLMLFSMFPMCSAIEPVNGNTNGSGVTRAIFVLLLSLLLIIFNEKNKNTLRSGVFLFLIIPFFNYYHTWSYYFVIYLTVVGIFAFRRRNERHIEGLVIYGIVTSFISTIFYNRQLLEEIARIIRFFPLILANFPSVSYTLEVNPEFLGYASLRSTYSYMQLINSMLILSLCLIFFWNYIKLHRKQELKLYEKMLFYFLMTQPFIACALFIWDGILGVYSRIFESLVYVVMLLAAYLLVKTAGSSKTIIRLIIVSAVFLCIVSYLSYPAELNWSLTDEEFKGIAFAGNHIPKTSYIFSDFRLGTPLIYFGQLGIKTTDASHHTPEITEEILERCYYNVFHPEIILDTFINKPDYYVLISSRQSEICIVDPSLKNFRPAPEDFQKKWEEELSFDKIYESMGINTYYRR